MTPFDFIKAVSETKESLITDDVTERSYEPFIVNRGLSFFPDTILYANEMNFRASLDGKPQFLYLLNTIRQRKRYSKWLKKEKNDDISLVSEFFGYSLAKSKDTLKILSKDQISQIRTQLEKGGVNTKERKNGR